MSVIGTPRRGVGEILTKSSNPAYRTARPDNNATIPNDVRGICRYSQTLCLTTSPRSRRSGSSTGWRNKTFRALDPAEAGDMPKVYVLDMFPYPSGAGLHVGHPEGLHRHRHPLPLQADARLQRPAPDGLGRLRPARRAVRHQDQRPSARSRPRRTSTTSAGRSRCSASATTGTARSTPPTPTTTSWTQWIFLQLFDTWYDPIDQKARPIAHLINELLNENLRRRAGRSMHVNPHAGRHGGDRRRSARRAAVARADRRRAARRHRRPAAGVHRRGAGELVPGPGHGAGQRGSHRRQERSGGYPVVRLPLRQWMLRITAYAERLLDDLDTLDWPERSRRCSANWIGQSEGAEVDFDIAPPDATATTNARERPGRRDDDDRRIRLHHPARHALRRDLHGAGARASAGRSHHHAERSASRSRRTARGRRARATSTAGRREEEDRRLHRRLRDQPGQRRARSRSGSPTTC